MSDEIIITTETVKVSEMNTRDKSIYDAGYEAGWERAKDTYDLKKRWDLRFLALLIGIIFGAFLVVVYFNISPTP